MRTVRAYVRACFLLISFHCPVIVSSLSYRCILVILASFFTIRRLVFHSRCIARILAHPAHANMPADFQCGVLAISAAEGPIGGAFDIVDSRRHSLCCSLMFVVSSCHVVSHAPAFSIRPGFTYALNTTMHEARSALPAVVPAREFSTLA